MRRIFAFFLPIFFIAVSTANAAEPIVLNGVTTNELTRQFQFLLPGVRAAVPGAVNSLDYIQQHTDKNKMTHARLQQKYKGFPVFGGYAILHSKQKLGLMASDKRGVKMTGMVFGGLTKELGQPDPSFSERAKTALASFKSQFPTVLISEEQVAPLVYIDDAHQAHWAYKVSVLYLASNKIPERPTAILDATTLKPFVQWNDIKTIRSDVKGFGYGGNPRTGSYQYGKDLPLLKIQRDNDNKLCFMQNKDSKVIDMEHRERSFNKAMQFECDDDTLVSDITYWTGYNHNGYDEQNGAYSATNDALYFAQVIRDMYKDWYDLDALSYRGKPMQLVMRVHYGHGYENAFWDGQQMTFGDGEEYFYPLVSLGIGAHEISHGFTEQNSDLAYFGQSGGMNESFSDMAAQAAEFYARGKSSWLIGADVLKESSGIESLRYMEKPSRDGRSIDSADQYDQDMDVHYTSGVYNRLFYLLSTTPGWDVKKAFHVMIKANMDYWTPYSTFEAAGCGVMSAAKDLGYPLDDVKKALEGVVISSESCGNFT